MSKKSNATKRRQERISQLTPIGVNALESPPSLTGEPQAQGEIFSLPIPKEATGGLFQKINSTDKGERQWAIVSLSRLVVEDPEVYSGFCKNPALLDQIIKSIFDGEMGVRVAATGLLRNLSADMNPLVTVVCEKMIQYDCLSSLIAVIQNFSNSYQSIDNEESVKDINEITELLVNTMCLFTNLCEISESCLERFAKENMFSSIIGFLTLSVPIDLVKYSAVFLNVLTEDFEPVLRQVQEGHLAVMREMSQNELVPLHIRVILCGVMINIKQGLDRDLPYFLPIFQQALNFDGKNIFLGILKSEEMSQQLAQDSENLPEEFNEELENWKDLMDSQINSLEILTNLLIDENSEEDHNCVFQLPPYLSKALLDSGVFNQVMPLCAFVEPTILILEKVPPLVSYLNLLKRVNSVAIACLGNIVLSLPEEALCNVQVLWNFLFVLLIAAFELPDVTLDSQRNIASTMFSLVRRTKIIPDEKQVELISKLFSHTDPELRVYSVGILGKFALATMSPQIATLLAEIILKGLNDESGLVIVESIDTIFSVFDDQFDEVTKSHNILQMLDQFAAYLKNKIQSVDQASNPLLFDKLNEVLINIPEFLKYKKYKRQ